MMATTVKHRGYVSALLYYTLNIKLHPRIEYVLKYIGHLFQTHVLSPVSNDALSIFV
jgi:hypothetical protein